ncbi:MAG TPA: hypothetical protein VN428_03850 [Bryobacteraceae bacterium]|nr:hypothetical protein [Bryobacteraceae bacterium]
MPGRNDFDPFAPQKEAAMFYGLFLRGHSPDMLRQDIDIPRPLLQKWLSSPRYHEPEFRQSLERVYRYRKQVLAIFDELVGSRNEKTRLRLQ